MDHLPDGSVPKRLVTSLTVSDVKIALDETKLAQVSEHFGGTEGGRGDAANSLGWVCFQGMVGKNQSVLWLMSGEMNADSIGGFQWRLISQGVTVDRRCKSLPSGQAKIELSHGIRVGMTESQLLRVLGQPTKTMKNKLLYVYDKDVSIRNESYSEINLLAVVVRNGTVLAIEAWKSTMS
jgi:hypothetical protein